MCSVLCNQVSGVFICVRCRRVDGWNSVEMSAAKCVCVSNEIVDLFSIVFSTTHTHPPFTFRMLRVQAKVNENASMVLSSILTSTVNTDDDDDDDGEDDVDGNVLK